MVCNVRRTYHKMLWFDVFLWTHWPHTFATKSPFNDWLHKKKRSDCSFSDFVVFDMDPALDSVASSLDPNSRYYSMVATVNILNQARKGKRRVVGSFLPISLSTATSKTSSSSLNRQQSSDSSKTNVPYRVKSRWQQVLPRSCSNRLKPVEGTPIPDVALQEAGNIANKSQGRADPTTAVGLAAAEMILRRRKIRSWRVARKVNIIIVQRWINVYQCY